MAKKSSKKSPGKASPTNAKAASDGASPTVSSSSKEGETTAEFRRLVVQEQVRSLRRRLWHAFENEDVDTALRAYKATARDLQAWIREEIQEAKVKEEARLQEEKEKKESQRPTMMKKLSLSARIHSSANSTNNNSTSSVRQQLSPSRERQSRMSFRRRSTNSHGAPSKESSLFTKMKKPPPNSAAMPAPVAEMPSEAELIMSDTTNSDNALLPLHMNPSEPFLLDDYKDPMFTIDPATGEPRSVAAMQDAENKPEQSQTLQPHTGGGRHFKPFRKRKNRNSQEQQQQQQPRTATSSFWASLKIGRGARDAAATAAAAAATTPAPEDPSEVVDPSESASPDSANNPNDPQTIALTDPKMTTPLHEAARLGNAELVRLMLSHAFVEPNFKNGQKRTALHMVAGGWTEPEERLWRSLQQKIKTKLQHQKKLPGGLKTGSVQAQIGISSPVPISIESTDATNRDENDNRGGRKAARAMTRFFSTKFASSNKGRNGGVHNGDLKPPPSAQTESQGYLVWDEQLWNQLRTERMDCLLAILTWSHPDDGTASAGEGASVNAVDGQGRTALHYAAELGREDVCMAVLSSFGAMLTVVDDSARTPCELAAEQHHPELAAQLEARALLYSDPYGMDDELLAAVMAEQQMPDDDDLDVSENESLAIVKARMSLVAPFLWFRTLSVQDVNRHRSKRLADCCMGMMSHLKAKEEENELKKVMYGMKTDEDGDEEQADDTKESKASGSAKKEEACVEKEGSESEAKVSHSGEEGDKSIADKEAGKGEEGNGDKEQNVEDCSDTIDPPGISQNEDDSAEPTRKAKQKRPDGKPKDDPPGQTVTLQASTDTSNSPGEEAKEDETRLTEDDILSLKSIQTAHIALFLSRHGWIVEKALTAFKERPAKAIEEAGVSLEAVLHAKQRTGLKSENAKDDSISSSVCLICFDEFEIGDGDKWTHLTNCSHSFCNTCLGDYLVDCAKSRSTGLSVPCPHHECVMPMAQPEIKSLAPNEEVFAMLQKTANDNFVASANDLRFCSHPGCNGIVKVTISQSMKKWGVDFDQLACAGAVCTAVHPVDDKKGLVECGSSPIVTYEGVIDPQNTNSRSTKPPIGAHRFCFGCGEREHHFPVTCECLEEWKKKMMDEVEQLKDDGEAPEEDEKYGDIAQRLWMRANTRPCPKCKAPIEKNEGCNHMTCFNPQCKHEFCWICRKDWKLHNTATGGFFRCNRWQDEDNHDFYDAPPPPDQAPASTALTGGDAANDEVMNNPEVMAQTYGTAMHETRVAWKKSKEMKRFLHHYTRWNAHMESAALERNMSENVCSRLAPVVRAATEYTCDENFNFDGKGLSFVHAAFKELLECRSVLQHSYAYSFFKFESLAMKRARYGRRPWNEKAAFEQMQSELEIITEQMSDIVARSHLRATQTQILFLTVGASERRNEFCNLIFTLVNEEKKRKRDGTSERKKGATRTLAVASPVGMANPSPDGLVVRGIASGSQGDASDDTTDADAQQQTTQETVREALLASLEAFMANTEDQPTVLARVDAEPDVDSEIEDFEEEDDDDQFRSWACSACTYMNSSGRRCAICGTPAMA